MEEGELNENNFYSSGNSLTNDGIDSEQTNNHTSELGDVS